MRPVDRGYLWMVRKIQERIARLERGDNLRSAAVRVGTLNVDGLVTIRATRIGDDIVLTAERAGSNATVELARLAPSEDS